MRAILTTFECPNPQSERCLWRCAAREDGGCVVQPGAWTPAAKMTTCAKFRVWRCKACPDAYEGHCAVSVPYQPLCHMGACPRPARQRALNIRKGVKP